MFDREIQDFEIIERWGVIRLHRRGSLGAHSHRVAIYADQIAEIIEWEGDKAELLRYALWHDAAEIFTGDIPGPVKRATADPVKLGEFEAAGIFDRFRVHLCPTPDIAAIVKVADVLDELLWVTVDESMGNRMLGQVISGSRSRLTIAVDALADVGVSPDKVHNLYQRLAQAVRAHATHPSMVVSQKD